MARNFFSVPAKTVGLTTATAKSVVGVLAATNICLNANGFVASFDGATSSNAPVVVEICTCTFATNGPGTNSASQTPAKNDTGRAETIQATAGNTWTAEPTVVTPYKNIDIGQFNGAYEFVVPFSTPIVFIGGKGGVIRCTSPNGVNCSADIAAEE
jgi:hypothetical protein